MKHHQKMEMRKMHLRRQTMSDCHLEQVLVLYASSYVFKKEVGKLINVFMFILCKCSYCILFIYLHLCFGIYMIYILYNSIRFIILNYLFLDMRRPGGGRSGREIAGRGRTGGRGTSHSSPSAATEASSSSVVAPSYSSAHPPEQHYRSEEKDLGDAEEEVLPTHPDARVVVQIDTDRYNLSSSTRHKGF